MSMHRSVVIRPVVCFALVTALLHSTTVAQDYSAPNYDRLVINADGTVVYFEPLDKSEVNRLEYRNRVRPTLEIFSLQEEGEKKITVIDYDSDERPDFIRVEKTAKNMNVETVGFYRGPKHKEHEESHLEHALEHSFVRRDSMVARELRDKLRAMRERTIRDDEVGLFTGYSLFAELNLSVIESAFASSDSLFRGLDELTSMSLETLRKAPHLSSRYRSEIRKLISINPHTLGIPELNREK
jgi:hypothetical protein